MEKESGSEKLFRFGKKLNIIGAVALGGAAIIIPGPNLILASLAAIDVAQAVGFEGLRRWQKKKKGKSTS